MDYNYNTYREMSSCFSLGKVTLIYNVWNVSEAERDQNIHVI